MLLLFLDFPGSRFSGLVAKSCPTLCVSMDHIACQATLSLGFPRQQYWSGSPFPSSRSLPDSGSKPGSLALQAVFSDWTSREALPGGARCNESTCKSRRLERCSFHAWDGKTLWRRSRQPTRVFLPREAHGQRSLVGYSPRIAKSWTRLKRLSMHAAHCFYYTACSLTL